MAVVSSTSTFMRLKLLANGPFLTLVPMMVLPDRFTSAWLRSVNVDLSDSGGTFLSITVKKRRSARSGKALSRGQSRRLH